MKAYWMRRGLKFVVLAAVAVTAISFIVMSLWNGLIPALFGGPTLTFAQALGLLVLSRILFGRLRGGFGPGMYWRRRFRQQWRQLSPAEQQQLRERCGRRWGERGVPEQEPNV